MQTNSYVANSCRSDAYIDKNIDFCQISPEEGTRRQSQVILNLH